jgi:hypothetical protein
MEATLIVSGMKQIREAWEMKPHTDPRRAVATVMKEIGCQCSVDRIFIADRKAEGDIQKVNTVGIQFRSSYHKTEALIKMKQLLHDYKVTGVNVRDGFPPGTLEEAKRKTAEGQAMKRKGAAASYRVINIKGQPVLQVRKKRQNRFHTVEEERQPAEEEAGRAANGADRDGEQRGRAGGDMDCHEPCTAAGQAALQRSNKQSRQ